MSKIYNLSNQAVGSLMMAVQQGLIAASNGKSKEECDIVAMVKGFQLQEENGELVVLNPPSVSFDEENFSVEE